MIFCPKADPQVESTNTKPKLQEKKPVSNEHAVACANNAIQKLLDNQPNFKVPMQRNFVELFLIALQRSPKMTM